jgi:hypothetical protein
VENEKWKMKNGKLKIEKRKMIYKKIYKKKYIKNISKRQKRV